MSTPCTTQPDLWFSEDRRNINHAKKVCGDCPVRLECLRLALDGNEAFGIFGGLTPEERARMTVTTPSDKVCALPECNTYLPVATGNSGRRRYCSPGHTKLASGRAYKARQVAS